ncbi:Anti-repressor SinI [Alteribacillus persepolensis]|uniref:Anti-repressor SinI n=1 Tax=Alteribacillus persepolensis TaxID=568899 RepID=A0A1G8C651_9BACI|nr:anti-repressor SinI family protein [Alteribacillus persepolensis]SDH40844.1 Anti-repressor SinI [Alteribacillus persepolensis]
MVIPVQLDQEWVQLIREAKDAGLTAEEVMIFIQKQKNY